MVRSDSLVAPLTTGDNGGRLTSLDAFRGLVMLLLIPDIYGGFSFYEMDRRFPDDPLWAFLARQFTHVQWSGWSVWDLVMPSFLLMVGVSMPYSYAARMARGDSQSRVIAHAVLRAIALMMLGIVLLIPVRAYLDLLWPLLLLALGLPVPKLLSRVLGTDSAGMQRAIEVLWWIGVLSASGIHLFLSFHRVENLAFHDILPQIGLGYVFAFLLVNRGRLAQAAAAFAVLAAYWLAFLLYPVPPPGFDLAKVGLWPGEEVFGGYFAHWNKNTNLAAAIDTWFLNLFPRAAPFVFNEHGYQTLNFVPSIATMIFGVMAGEYLRSHRPRAEPRNGLLKAGVFGVVLGLLAGWVLCPIVKSIWTPSWTLFSAGCAAMMLAVFYDFTDVRRWRRWALPLVVAGTNPILLYTLASYYRWWVVEAWRRTLGPSVFAAPAAPVLESLLFGVSLWALAFVFYRLRIFSRI